MQGKFGAILAFIGLAFLAQPLWAAPPPVPPPIAETIPPPPSGSPYTVIWQPGHYDWSGQGYIWRSGEWVRQVGGLHLWQPGYWAVSPEGETWVSAHWVGNSEPRLDQSAADAVRFVSGIYSRYYRPGVASGVDTVMLATATPSLAALFKKDVELAERYQENGALNFDPFCNCQDPDVMHVIRIHVELTAPGMATATVDIRYDGSDPNQQVTLLLRRINGNWRVDDIPLGGSDTFRKVLLEYISSNQASGIQDIGRSLPNSEPPSALRTRLTPQQAILLAKEAFVQNGLADRNGLADDDFRCLEFETDGPPNGDGQLLIDVRENHNPSNPCGLANGNWNPLVARLYVSTKDRSVYLYDVATDRATQLRNPQPPSGPIDQIYRPYLSGNQNPYSTSLYKLFSESFLQSYRKAASCGNLADDPFVGTAYPVILGNVTTRTLVNDGRRALVTAHLVSKPDEWDVKYKLVDTERGWLIDDVNENETNQGWWKNNLSLCPH